MPSRPNVLLIMSDQHSPHALGHRDPNLQTPVLDELAREGTRFSAACTPCPLCVPARASFVTSRFPHEIGVNTNDDALGSHEPTFAHALAAAGYDTALIGRMHFLGHDQWHGFARRLVGDIGSQHLGRTNPLGPFTTNSGTQLAAIRNSGAGVTGHQLFDDRVTEAAVAELQRWHRHRGAGQAAPFLYVVGLHLPHSPYRAPREAFDRYRDTPLPPREPVSEMSDYARRYHAHCRLHEASEADEQRARAAYCAMVSETDRRVGIILAALRQLRLDDQTIVIYTSDHGDHAGEHRLWWKESFYEASVGVPLIVRGPGIAADRCVTAPVSLLDMGPTLTDLAAAPPLPLARGKSLWPLLQGGPADADRPVFSQLAPGGFSVASRMVRMGRLKLIHYDHDELRDELYDLQADPDERRNRIDDPALASPREALRARLKDHDWCAATVRQAVDRSRANAELLKRWTHQVDPLDPWSFLQQMPISVNQPQ